MMPKRSEFAAIDRLSPAERLALIEVLWDSLEANDIPITAAEREELDHRLAEGVEEPGAPWEDLKAELLKRTA